MDNNREALKNTLYASYYANPTGKLTTQTSRLTDRINVIAYSIEEGTKSTRQAPTRRQAKRAAHMKADKVRYHGGVGTSKPTCKVTTRKAAHRRAFLRGAFE